MTTHTLDTTRVTWRIPKQLKDVLDFVLAQRNMNLLQADKLSMNDLINEIATDYVKQLALSGKLEAKIAEQISPAALTALLLARIEAAEDSIYELRRLGEEGHIPSFEQFQYLQKTCNAEIRDALMRDIAINGPLVYREPQDEEAIRLRAQSEKAEAIEDLTGEQAATNDAEADMLKDLKDIEDL